MSGYEVHETGGSIPVSKRQFVGYQASEPSWIPTKYSAIIGPLIYEQVFFHYDHMKYNAAQIEYKFQHGKLPASDRTKRLRKKRRSIIMKWRYGK